MNASPRLTPRWREAIFLLDEGIEGGPGNLATPRVTGEDNAQEKTGSEVHI